MDSQPDLVIVELLIANLLSDDFEPPEAALIRARGRTAVPTLLAVLRGDLDEQFDDRGIAPVRAHGSAAWMLSQIGDPSAIQPILDIVTRVDPVTDQETPLNSLWDALVATGSAAFEPTLQAYASAEVARARPGLGFVLSRLGVRDERLFPIIVETFYEDLFWGAYAMRNYGDQRAVPHLKYALDRFLPHAYSNNIDDTEAEYEAILDALSDLGALTTEEGWDYDERLDEHYRRLREASEQARDHRSSSPDPDELEVTDADTAKGWWIPRDPTELPN